MISDKLNYIVEGVTYRFFYLNNYILYCDTLNNKGEEPEVIHREVTNYVVNKDINGVIHIAIIDSTGRLFHIFNENNEWKKRKIEYTNLKPSLVKDLNIYICPNDPLNISIIFIIYSEKNNNLWSIIQFFIKRNRWSSKILDKFFAEKHDAIIKADMDSKGNIHLLYKSKFNDKYTLFYRMYSIDTSKWNYPERICSNSKLSNINILCDSNNYVNTSWSELKNKDIIMNHSRKKISSANSYSWKKSKSLSANNSNFIDPILFQYNDYIILIWKDNNKFNFTKTKIDEDNWTVVQKIGELNTLELKPVSFIGERYKDYKFVKVPYTYYWCNKDDISLLGLDTQLENMNNFNSKKDKDISKGEFDKYIESVNMYFKDNSNFSKLLPEHFKRFTVNKKNTITNNDLDMNKFTKKLIDLYYEIEELKNKELMLYNSLFKIRSQHISLYEKIEDILKDFENLK